MRGRLIVPEDQKGDVFVRVYLELQNTLNVLGDRKIRYSDEALSMKVTDESGRAVSVSGMDYEGFSEGHQGLVMPFDSQLRFLINGHGTGVPGDTAWIVDFGPMHSWIMPASIITSIFFLER